MRCLIIHSDPPPSGINETGAVKRLRLYVNAISRIANDIEMLFFVSEQYSAATLDLDRLATQQSTYWGRNVEVGLIPLSRRRETNWNHYVASSIHIIDHPHFHAFVGTHQSSIVETALSKKPDFIHVFTLAALMPLLSIRTPLPPIFFDLDDIEHKSRFRRSIEPPYRAGKLLSATQTFAIHLAERRANRLSKRTIVCSEADRRYLKNIGLTKLEVIPNAVAIPSVELRFVQQRTLGFIGNFWHPPNVSAAARLVAKVWPLIRAMVPDARLLIAGNPPHLIPSFANPPDGVEFLGYIDRIEDFYSTVSVICCPMMSAGGTRVKLIEAALFGKPIVSTSVGAEGLDFVLESEIYVRSLDRAFAVACVELLIDTEAAARIGLAAKQRAEHLYDVGTIETRIELMMRKELNVLM